MAAGGRGGLGSQNDVVDHVPMYPCIHVSQRKLPNPAHGEQQHFLPTQKDFQLSDLADFVCSLNSPSNPSRHSASPLPHLGEFVSLDSQTRMKLLMQRTLQMLPASPRQ
jgi:hypothetical protein